MPCFRNRPPSAKIRYVQRRMDVVQVLPTFWPSAYVLLQYPLLRITDIRSLKQPKGWQLP